MKVAVPMRSRAPDRWRGLAAAAFALSVQLAVHVSADPEPSLSVRDRNPRIQADIERDIGVWCLAWSARPGTNSNAVILAHSSETVLYGAGRAAD